jgi:hypothetical protein
VLPVAGPAPGQRPPPSTVGRRRAQVKRRLSRKRSPPGAPAAGRAGARRPANRGGDEVRRSGNPPYAVRRFRPLRHATPTQPPSVSAAGPIGGALGTPRPRMVPGMSDDGRAIAPPHRSSHLALTLLTHSARIDQANGSRSLPPMRSDRASSCGPRRTVVVQGGRAGRSPQRAPSQPRVAITARTQTGHLAGVHPSLPCRSGSTSRWARAGTASTLNIMV